MDSTHRLSLPYILPGQAQKHVSVNAAFSQLDALIQASVKSRSLPVPNTAEEGACFLYPATDDAYPALAQMRGGAFVTMAPRIGWQVFVEDEGLRVTFDGTEWRQINTPGAPNLLINSQFVVNQRGFSGGVLGAGVYGHDRWRGAPSGVDYTASNGQVTLVSGALQQVVDLPPGVTTLTFSARVTGAALTVTCAGQSHVMSVSAGQQSVTFTLPINSVVTTIELAGAGAVISELKLEVGERSTAFSPRSYADELDACLAYYEQIGPGLSSYMPVAIGTATSSNVIAAFVSYRRKMQTPSIGFHGQFQCVGLVNDSAYISNLSAFVATPFGCEMRATLTTTVTPQTSGLFRAHGDLTAFIAIDAEHH